MQSIKLKYALTNRRKKFNIWVNCIKFPNNVLKTECNYLQVQFNLSPLGEWNPRPSIKLWFQIKKSSSNSKSEVISQQYFYGVSEAQDVKEQVEDNMTFKDL